MKDKEKSEKLRKGKNLRLLKLNERKKQKKWLSALLNQAS
jgi:hypothetical protein